MTDTVKISDLPVYNMVKPTDLIPVVDTTDGAGGTTKQVTQTIRSASGVYHLPSNPVAGTSQTVAENNIYVPKSASLTTFTVPASFAAGSTFGIRGEGSGGWVVVFQGGQVGHVGATPTTSGGNIASTNRYDCLHAHCTTADTTFVTEALNAALLSVN
jgi:hypothetical protein